MLSVDRLEAVQNSTRQRLLLNIVIIGFCISRLALI